MQFDTFIHARAACPRHGARGIKLPWTGFALLIDSFAIQLLQSTRSMEYACKLLRLEWFQAQGIMDADVERGMARREQEGVACVAWMRRSPWMPMLSPA